jgi:hypothetical protein
MPAAVVFKSRKIYQEDLATGVGTETVDVMGIGPTALTMINLGGTPAGATEGDLTGTVNGVNAAFTISPYSSSTFLVMIIRNGIVLASGTGYTRVLGAVTFLAGYIPQVGDSLRFITFHNA